MGIWMSILVVLAVTRRASAEGELETDSERDKRKFASLHQPTNDCKKVKPFQDFSNFFEGAPTPSHAIDNIVIEWEI